MSTLITSYSANATYDGPIASDSYHTDGSTFELTGNSTYTLNSVAFTAYRFGSPTGDCYAVLYSTSGSPGAYIPASLVETSTGIAVSSLPTSGGTKTTFTFSGTTDISPSTVYYLGLNYTNTVSSTGSLLIAESSAVSGMNQAAITGSSSTNSSYTIAMDVYGTILAPVASFTGVPTTLNAGDSVQFTDTSTNTPTSWSWTFGDTGTSTSQNPTHTYTTAATYTVALTATNSTGSNTDTKTNYITVVTPQTLQGVSSITGISSMEA